MNTIKNIFWNGIKAFLPAAITLSLCVWLFKNIEHFFGDFLKYFIKPEHYVPGMGILLGVITVFFMGAIINAWIVKKIYHLLENIVKQIPLVKTLYNAIIDVLGFFDKSENKKQRVVAIDTYLGRQIGLVTRESLSSLPNGFGNGDSVLVYLPFSCQIGGFMVAIPRDKVYPLDISVDEAIALVASAGIIGQSTQSSPFTPTEKKIDPH